MSKRPRSARSTRHQRPPRPAGPSARAPAQGAAAAPGGAIAPAESMDPLATSVSAPRPAPSRPQGRTGAKSSGLLAARAANEYVYVAQDLRRIGTFASIMAAVMVVVWVLVDLAHAITP